MTGITQARIVPALETLEDFEKTFQGLVYIFSFKKNYKQINL